MEVINNKWGILYIITIIILMIYVINAIKQQRKIKKLEKQIINLNNQNNKLIQEQNIYKNNVKFIEKFIDYYFILTTILTSKLGAKADGFTYRTFVYKKENGVTIEKKQGAKKITVKGEVGYIIKDKYFIKKADLDILLLSIQQQIDEELKMQKINYNIPLNYYTLLIESPNLLDIEVEDVRGENKYNITPTDIYNRENS